jgi:hypothetical protein
MDPIILEIAVALVDGQFVGPVDNELLFRKECAIIPYGQMPTIHKLKVVILPDILVGYTTGRGIISSAIDTQCSRQILNVTIESFVILIVAASFHTNPLAGDSSI